MNVSSMPEPQKGGGAIATWDEGMATGGGGGPKYNVGEVLLDEPHLSS